MIIFRNNKNFLLTKNKYSLITRTMRTMAFTLKPKMVKISHGVLQKNNSNSMSYMRNCNFKKNSQASKDLASDESGKHTHRLKELCEKQDCEIQKCPSLCYNLKSVSTNGHYTHNPIPGKSSRHLSDKDANGNDNSQYFTKNSDQNKKASGNKAQDYYKNKEIKNASKMDNFTKDPKISKKLDE